MLPAEAYTSPGVLSWERRFLFAGSWTCLGRVADLLASPDRPVTQRAVVVGDIPALLVRDGAEVRMFANTCRHRGHELLAEGETSQRRSIVCPYHAWSYDLEGSLRAAKGFRDDETFDVAAHGLVELPVRLWEGWVFAHALHPASSGRVPSFTDHLGAVAAIITPYACAGLVVADRHTYEVAANWKVVAENYHECYHCPLIHPELCAVTPPDSGDNYDLPGAWVGGAMDLREGMATMSMTGEPAATPLPGVDPRRVGVSCSAPPPPGCRGGPAILPRGGRPAPTSSPARSPPTRTPSRTWSPRSATPTAAVASRPSTTPGRGAHRRQEALAGDACPCPLRLDRESATIR
jgi:Rieske 2Fe-2S family protein